MRRLSALLVVLLVAVSASATFDINGEKVKFSVKYATEEVPVSSDVVISQSGLPFADMDYVAVRAGNDIIPINAVQDGVDVSRKLSAIDNDVIEMTGPVRVFVPASGTLLIHANEYGHANPMRYPLHGFASAPVEHGSFVFDGRLDDVRSPSFTAFMEPGTGHPSGNVYGFVRSDGQFTYVLLDITIDNTDDPGEDWAALNVKTSNGVKRFFVSASKQEFGLSSFGYTSSVPYEHKVYEFRLPVALDKFEFFLEYYGTVAAFCGDGLVNQPSEECDDGCNVGIPGICEAIDDGDGCSSICLSEKDVDFVLFDLALGHNMLFSKVMDLLHIVKDLIVQLELKTIEIQLTDFQCSEQPVSFWIPASSDPYGKLNEIDSLIGLLIQSLRKGIAESGNPATFGAVTAAVITGVETGSYQDGIDNLAAGNYREAFECFAVSYATLADLPARDCTCDPVVVP